MYIASDLALTPVDTNFQSSAIESHKMKSAYGLCIFRLFLNVGSQREPARWNQFKPRDMAFGRWSLHVFATSNCRWRSGELIYGSPVPLQVPPNGSIFPLPCRRPTQYLHSFQFDCPTYHEWHQAKEPRWRRHLTTSAQTQSNRNSDQ